MTMTGSAALDRVLLVAVLLAAVVSAVRLVAGRRRQEQVDAYLSGPDADAAHLVMNLGMAWMLAPWYGLGGRVVLIVVFAAVAAVFAGLLVRGAVWPAPRRRSARPSYVYHLLASAAMLYATVLMDVGSMGTGSMGTGSMGTGSMGMGSMDVGSVDMGGMSMDGASMGGGGGPTAVLAWVLVVLFALDGVVTAVLAFLFPDTVLAGPGAPAGQGAAASAGSTTVLAPARDVGSMRRTLRIAAVPHVIMDAGMVAMLVAIT